MAKSFDISCKFTEYNSPEELESEDKKLLMAAKTAASKAYAPYSHFKVGAAVLLENGTIVTGNNQENAAYPSGMCAERVTLFYASSQFPDQKIKALAISATSEISDIHSPVSPCGACRQVMAEYEIKLSSAIKVIMSGQLGKVVVCDSVTSLLPLMFDSSLLKNSSL